MEDKVTGIDRFKRRKNISLVAIFVTVFTMSIVVLIGVFIKARSLYKESQNNSIVAKKVALATPSIGPLASLGLPEGFTAKVFAGNLPRARDLVFSPGGTLLVSELDVNKVVALPDKNIDGVADSIKQIATGNIPHGLAFSDKYLFVAELDKVVRYKWDEATLTATFDKQLFTLTTSGHSSRTIVVYPDGRLYVSVGSSCNVCVEKSNFVAGVLESNINGDNPHVYTTGQRNASFLAVNPITQKIWATENSRDLLGDDVPPDEINILEPGKNYGWPYCYADKIRDLTFNASTNFDCLITQRPTYKIQAHSAPLGLAFIPSIQFPYGWQDDLLVSFHGSWNRSVSTGYKVVRLNVKGSSIIGQTDFMNFKGGDLGRPVDLIFDQFGNLYVSDDKTGAVYIVQRL